MNSAIPPLLYPDTTSTNIQNSSIIQSDDLYVDNIYGINTIFNTLTCNLLYTTSLISNNIYVTTLTSNLLYTTSLTSNNIDVTTLTGNYINCDELSVTTLTSNYINADKLSVTTTISNYVNTNKLSVTTITSSSSLDIVPNVIFEGNVKFFNQFSFPLYHVSIGDAGISGTYNIPSFNLFYGLTQTSATSNTRTLTLPTPFNDSNNMLQNGNSIIFWIQSCGPILNISNGSNISFDTLAVGSSISIPANHIGQFMVVNPGPGIYIVYSLGISSNT